jgi:hypothetical protein
VISLGAGVQSTALYLLACDGQLGPVDTAIFADTGWEPGAVYDHLARLEDFGNEKIPIRRVGGGNLRDTQSGRDFADVPYFLFGRKGRPKASRTTSRSCKLSASRSLSTKLWTVR